MANATITEDIAPVAAWLDQWKPAGKERGQWGGMKARRQRTGVPEKRLRKQMRAAKRQARRDARAVDTLMAAMRASTPQNPALLPGPGIVPTGRLPEQFRQQLPKGNVWIGMDPSRLDTNAMEYLIRMREREM